MVGSPRPHDARQLRRERCQKNRQVNVFALPKFDRSVLPPSPAPFRTHRRGADCMPDFPEAVTADDALVEPDTDGTDSSGVSLSAVTTPDTEESTGPEDGDDVFPKLDDEFVEKAPDSPAGHSRMGPGWAWPAIKSPGDLPPPLAPALFATPPSTGTSPSASPVEEEEDEEDEKPPIPVRRVLVNPCSPDSAPQLPPVLSPGHQQKQQKWDPLSRSGCAASSFQKHSSLGLAVLEAAERAVRAAAAGCDAPVNYVPPPSVAGWGAWGSSIGQDAAGGGGAAAAAAAQTQARANVPATLPPPNLATPAMVAISELDLGPDDDVKPPTPPRRKRPLRRLAPIVTSGAAGPVVAAVASRAVRTATDSTPQTPVTAIAIPPPPPPRRFAQRPEDDERRPPPATPPPMQQWPGPPTLSGPTTMPSPTIGNFSRPQISCASPLVQQHDDAWHAGDDGSIGTCDTARTSPSGGGDAVILGRGPGQMHAAASPGSGPPDQWPLAPAGLPDHPVGQGGSSNLSQRRGVAVSSWSTTSSAFTTPPASPPPAERYYYPASENPQSSPSEPAIATPTSTIATATGSPTSTAPSPTSIHGRLDNSHRSSGNHASMHNHHHNHHHHHHHHQYGPGSAYTREPIRRVRDGESTSSFRSQNTESTAHATSTTGRSSLVTKSSSATSVYASVDDDDDDEGSIDDVMRMYEKGFYDDTDDEEEAEEARREDDRDEEKAGGWHHGQSWSGTAASRPAEEPAASPSFTEAPMAPTPAPPLTPISPLSMHAPFASHPPLVSRAPLTSHAPFPSHASPSSYAPPSPHHSLLSRSRSPIPPSLSPSSPTLPFNDDALPVFEAQPASPVHGHLPPMARSSRQASENRDSAKSMGDCEKEQVNDVPQHVSANPPAPTPAAPVVEEDPGFRDRYGFKKANQYITREAYDQWDAEYAPYLERRRKKWASYMKESNLKTERPNRFPAPSAKTKRFIRKGIPPEWRGAAWFYYAKGPAILGRHPGLYDELVRRKAKTTDADIIERDLHRTFPDNYAFRPPGSSTATGAEPSGESEPPMISALRRVLLAFSIYNPQIGYCQSLNFVAGLLLLFVPTEEQAFWLLNIVTRTLLPGTHETSLEGSKVDLGVLMTCLRTSMPDLWGKLAGGEDGDDLGPSSANLSPTMTVSTARPSGVSGSSRRKRDATPISADRLPPITITMAAWFMSCFIGTLPIETTLRVWDVFFYEGSKTLFRIALAVLKAGEPDITAVEDPMEMYSVVQGIPRAMLDANALLGACFKRRNGFGHLSQGTVDEGRREMRERAERERAGGVMPVAEERRGLFRRRRRGRQQEAI